MSIAFRTSSGASGLWTTASSVSFAIPSALQVNDVFVVLLELDNTTGFITSATPSTSGTTTPVQQGSMATFSRSQGGGTLFVMSLIFTVSVLSGDPGATITFSFSGHTAEGAYAADGYSGVDTVNPIDVQGSSSASATSLANPSLATNFASELPLYLAVASTGATHMSSVPGTERTDEAPYAVFAEGTTTGGAGSTIGGVTFTWPSQASAIAWTASLKPSSGTPVSDSDTVTGSDTESPAAATLMDADSLSVPAFDAGEGIASTDQNSIQLPVYPPGHLHPRTWRQPPRFLPDPGILAASSADTASGLDADGSVSNATAIHDGDSTRGPLLFIYLRDDRPITDAGELIGVTDSDAASGADAGENVVAGGAVPPTFIMVPPIPPGLQSPAAWRQPRLVVTGSLAISDNETGSGGESDPVTIALSSADPANAAAESDPATIRLADTDSGSGKDAGEQRVDTQEAVLTYLVPPGHLSPAAWRQPLISGYPPPSGSIPVSDPDTFTGSESDPVTIALLDTDTGSGADGGESIALLDTDTGSGADGGESLSGPWSLVQKSTVVTQTASGTLTATISASTAGNLLILKIATGGSAAAPSSVTSGFTSRRSASVGTAPIIRVDIFDDINNAGGITSVSATMGNSAAMIVEEWTRPGASGAAVDATGGVTTSTPASPFSIVTSSNLTANHELAVSVFGYRLSTGANATIGAGTGFTQQGAWNSGVSSVSHGGFDSEADTGASSSGATLTDAVTSTATGAGNMAGAIVTYI